MPSRRELLKTGALGAAALLLAGYWATPQADPLAQPGGAATLWLQPQDAAIIRALAPVMLGLDGLPLEQVAAGVDRAVLGLPPALRQEVRQLFDLLQNRWARRWLAGIGSPWASAAPHELERFLRRWRNSRFQLKRSVYQALHQLINAAWYGNPASWAALGYRLPEGVVGMLP
ncbi:twin-arginine translocation signal domain-containing protein [Chromobacterium subtsugae]|uniref:Twin-arginine translocation signal domain-containing protein n=1 Tax=Chromobacterium subtsugae TaxID=251747 RepID=A0ABS7FEM2_9NEIS|nr:MULTISPECIES: twin-arginine translocation signal domain-containing protein [Chromobacterium]KUM04082.1 hypothetical protein Cv017_16340 [Chromobacterium subtsugae]KZE85101.1 hypothetical protein AWB61_21265 [Chromobacterium sp. F49]MBW7568312.1 twin-arginine translocation signal domain-containing protein [Chromobacterium subtsugae]MBW8288512.1 twin-arginine translocation signal domain-containing protein [Chromobacterium subtsugae]WSE89877.1 twin-arginine translocation signal domain-containi